MIYAERPVIIKLFGTIACGRGQVKKVTSDLIYQIESKIGKLSYLILDSFILDGAKKIIQVKRINVGES